MSETIFIDIETALQTRLDEIVGHPYIAWENDQDYRPSLGTKYWRVTNFYTGATLETTGALQKHTGFIQVDVYVSLEDGLTDLSSDLGKIYTAFNTIQGLYVNDIRVDILGVGRSKRQQREGSWFTGSLDINYRCYSH